MAMHDWWVGQHVETIVTEVLAGRVTSQVIDAYIIMIDDDPAIGPSLLLETLDQKLIPVHEAYVKPVDHIDIEAWVNIYRNGHITRHLFLSKEEADESNKRYQELRKKTKDIQISPRIGCVKLLGRFKKAHLGGG